MNWWREGVNFPLQWRKCFVYFYCKKILTSQASCAFARDVIAFFVVITKRRVWRSFAGFVFFFDCVHDCHWPDTRTSQRPAVLSPTYCPVADPPRTVRVRTSAAVVLRSSPEADAQDEHCCNDDQKEEGYRCYNDDDVTINAVTRFCDVIKWITVKCLVIQRKSCCCGFKIHILCCCCFVSCCCVARTHAI